MKMTDDEGVSLGEAGVKRLTSKAMLVVLFDRDNDEIWIPLSQIHDDSEVYDEDNRSGKLVVSSWFAEKEGLS